MASWLQGAIDELTGKAQRDRANSAMEGAVSTANGYNQQAINNTNKLNATEIGRIQDAFNQMMGINTQQNQLAQMGGAAGMAGNLQGLQALFQQAAAQQQQQMPYLQSHQAMMAGASPILQALAGQQAYNIDPNYHPIDYNGMANNLLPQFQQNLQGVMPLIQSLISGTGTPGAATGSGGQGGVGTAGGNGGSPMTPANINLAQMIMNNPNYALAMQAGNEGLDRSLAAQGMGNSSDAAWLRQKMQQQTLGNISNQMFQRNLDLYNQGSQPAPSFSNPAAMSAAQNAGNLGSGIAGVANALNTNASNRQSLIGNLAGNLNQTEAGNANTANQLLLGQGQNIYNQGVNMANNPAPSGLDFIGKLAGIYSGATGKSMFGNAFSGQTSSPSYGYFGKAGSWSNPGY